MWFKSWNDRNVYINITKISLVYEDKNNCQKIMVNNEQLPWQLKSESFEKLKKELTKLSTHKIVYDDQSNNQIPPEHHTF